MSLEQLILPGGEHLILPGGEHLILPGGEHLTLPGGEHLILPGGKHLILQGGEHLMLPGEHLIFPRTPRFSNANQTLEHLYWMHQYGKRTIVAGWLRHHFRDNVTNSIPRLGIIIEVTSQC